VKHRIKLQLAPTECGLYDIFASSDPVSNGPTPIKSVQTIRIVNEKSLLKDHTTYFSNDIDFLPRLVARMREFGHIDWIDDVNGTIRCEEAKTGIASRPFRKGVTQLSKWANFAGFLVFQICAHGGLSEVLQSINKTASWIGNSVLGIGEKASFTIVGAAHWFWGALFFVLVDLVVRWCNRTSERTYTNLLFNEDSALRELGRVLFWLMVLFPIGVWATAIALRG
jgi:hypothetical protein